MSRQRKQSRDSRKFVDGGLHSFADEIGKQSRDSRKVEVGGPVDSVDGVEAIKR